MSKLNNPMHVGYVVKRFPRFSETFILNEILELERQGVKVTIFSLLHPPVEPRHGRFISVKARVVYLPRQRATDAWSVEMMNCQASELTKHHIELFDGPSALREVFQNKPAKELARLILQAATVAMLASCYRVDHLHAHFASNATSVAMVASQMTGIRYSFTAHARDIYHHYVNPQVDNRIRRLKMAAASFVVTVSEYNREHLQSLLPDENPHHVKRLYNGVDLTQFRGGTDRSVNNVILSVGRLVAKKGFSDLIDACHILRQRAVDFQCIIVGDGPLHETLSEQIKKHELDTNVKLLGSLTQEALRNVMAETGIMVLPCVVTETGDRDGLPTVLLEAMAMGLPTVSTQVAGIPEIIEHEQTGLLVPPHDAHALADGIGRLLAHPVDAWQMGARGRQRAEQLFDCSRNVAQLASWFQESILTSVNQGSDSSCVSARTASCE